jgi:DNA-binding CsgD family transcriptional regulator
VNKGEIWVSHQAAARIISKLLKLGGHEEANPDELTPREWEILKLVADGFRNKEIAGRLHLSENTVKTHLYTTYRKLQVCTRLGAALRYFQRSKHRGDSGSVPSPEGKSKSDGEGIPARSLGARRTTSRSISIEHSVESPRESSE